MLEHFFTSTSYPSLFSPPPTPFRKGLREHRFTTLSSPHHFQYFMLLFPSTRTLLLPSIAFSIYALSHSLTPTVRHNSLDSNLRLPEETICFFSFPTSMGPLCRFSIRTLHISIFISHNYV